MSARFKIFVKRTGFLLLVLFNILVLGFSGDFFVVSAKPSETHYYLAHWEWATEGGKSFWRAPQIDKLLGLVDLRSLPAQGRAGGVPEGYGFFSYNQQVVIPDSIYLGDSLDATVPAPKKAQVRTALNITGPFQSDIIRDILWDILTISSDPLGQTGPKPLMPKETLELELYLGSILVKSELFDITAHSHKAKVLAVLQNAYRSEREFDKAQGSTHYLKVLGGWMEKYGVSDHTIFLPPDVPDEGWLQPETTITDNFNTDTSVNWTADGGAFQIDAADSNVLECTATECVLRYSATAFSSKDHYAQVKILTVGNSYQGPMIRKVNSATLTYYTHLFQGPGNPITQLFKRVNGTYSNIGGGNFNHTHVSGDLYKIQAQGTTITTYVNGEQAHSVTDSSIDEELRVGIVSATVDSDFEDFQASDLNSTPASPTSPTQLKTNDTTTISNGGYTNETSVNLKASATDADTTETLTLFFEVQENATSFSSTSTPVTGESCASGTAFASCPEKVWYITSVSGNYSSTAFTATSTVATLTNATGYKWQVKACDDDSACSSWVAFNATTPNFTIDTTVPSTPGTPSTTTPTTDTTPTWTWDASTDGGSGLHATTPYWVEWSTDANFSSSVSSSTAATASFTHSSALSDNTYYARIRALDAVSNESAYSASSTVVVDTTVPSTPGTPSTTTPTTDTTPTWTWDASTDGGSGLHATTPYWVEWSTDANFSSSVSSSTAATASFTHSTDLTDETTWYVRIKALDAVNNESAYSANATIAIDTTPPPGPGASSAGGSAAAGTAFLQQQGFLPTPTPIPTPVPPPSIIEQILEPFIPPFLRPTPSLPEPEPIPAEELPEEAPLALQGIWQLFPSQPIREFVLTPLPRGISNLIAKFPQLAQTLEQVGVSKITDLERLQPARLTLPGFTQITSGIPTDIVFVRGGGLLIDLPAVITVEHGEAQQRISTIANSPLHLTLKPEQSAHSVKGYLVWRQKNPNQISSSQNPKQELPLNSLLASTFAQTSNFQDLETELVLLEFEYTGPDQDGLWSADITTPAVEGEYEMINVVEYEDPELGTQTIRLITVVDPEGYVYRQSNKEETRIANATVSLYWWNTQANQYQLWPAKEYQQENPQITDVTGRYSFLVSEGSYYLTVEASGYLPYQGEVFQVKGGTGVHENIELKAQYWWLKAFDWKFIALIVFGLLLFYNFYRDRLRKRFHET